MKYQIESKSDLSGVMLVVHFPEKDLDTKALYTIQADRPDFLVPFRFRCVDGEAECTYQLGGRNKLLYRCVSRDPRELTGFWERVLQPLLDCGDWFLKPFSFVLDVQYLYIDQEGKTVSYLYIPSKQDCADSDSLRELAAELAQKNPSTDAGLEVKVLRAIMQDFQPSAFLQMLRETQPAALAKTLAPEVHAPTTLPVKAEPIQPALEKQASHTSETSEAQKIPQAPKESKLSDDGDIHIDLPGSEKSPKPKKEKKSIFGHKEEKKKKKEGGLFGKKKGLPKEIILGAAAESPTPVSAVPFAAVDSIMEEDNVTVLQDPDTPTGCHFRLVGEPGLPREIPVVLDDGGIFTIGRFDVTVGRKQSDFEFAGKTKAVSRHHAAIERTEDGGYAVVDLGSAAGTYVDGERLTPNVACRLSPGCRIAFGTAGADYVWEE